MCKTDSTGNIRDYLCLDWKIDLKIDNKVDKIEVGHIFVALSILGN